MLKANQTQIKDKIMDLKEKVQKQKEELKKQIESKNKNFDDLLNKNNEGTKLLAIFGLLHIMMIIAEIQKGHNLKQLKESLKTQNLLQDKDNLVDKLYVQVKERIDIIEKAETNDLKDFLKDNDVYAIFENGKLEEFLDKDNLDLKQNEIKKDKSKEVSNER